MERNVKGKNNPRYNTGLCMPGSKQRGIYNSWQNMKGRCLRPSSPKYPRYGGRGIKIFKPWLDICEFYKWAVGSGWKKGLTLDRIDNDGDYCPSNCQWVSLEQNSRKKSTTRLSFEQAKEIRERSSKGECNYKLAKEFGVVHGTVWFIVKNFIHVGDGECTKAIKRRNNRKKQIPLRN